MINADDKWPGIGPTPYEKGAIVMTTHAELNEPVDELTAEELDLITGGMWGFSGYGSSSGSGSGPGSKEFVFTKRVDIGSP